MNSMLIRLEYFVLVVYKTVIIQFTNHLIHLVLVFIYHFAERIQVVFFSGIEYSFCDPFGSRCTPEEQLFEFCLIYFFNRTLVVLKACVFISTEQLIID